jgi:hypothetical protein
LDDELRWNEHIAALEGKLSKGLFILRNISRFDNQNLIKMVYLGLVETHITYSVVLWGAGKGNLEKKFSYSYLIKYMFSH